MEKDHEFVPHILNLRCLKDVEKSVTYTEFKMKIHKALAWGLLEKGNNKMSLQKIKTGFKVYKSL